MTTANLRITPDDWRDATVTCSVTPPTGFEVTNTQNEIRGDLFRTPDTTTMTIRATWPQSRIASALQIYNHLLHGANFNLKLYTDAAWLTPSSPLAASGVTAALCYTTTTDGYTNSLGTKDPHKADSPTWYYFGESPYQSAEIVISGTPSAVSYFQIGTIILGRYFEAAVNPVYGMQLGEVDTGGSSRTEGGSKRGYPGESWPTLTGDLDGINENERTFWRDFMKKAKRSVYFGVSVFPGDGTTLERDHTICGTFSSLDAIGRQVSRLTKRIQVEGS